MSSIFFFSVSDPTAFIGAYTSLNRPQSAVAVNYPYENRTGNFFHSDKQEPAINFLGAQANKNQFSVQKDNKELASEEKFSSDIREPSKSLGSSKLKTETLYGRKSYSKPDPQEKVDEYHTPEIFQFRNGRTSSKIMKEIININISPSPTVLPLNSFNQDEAMNVHIGFMDRKAHSAQEVNNMPREKESHEPFGPLAVSDDYNINQGNIIAGNFGLNIPCLS